MFHRFVPVIINLRSGMPNLEESVLGIWYEITILFILLCVPSTAQKVELAVTSGASALGNLPSGLSGDQ
jgi:hypothetical protein